MATKLTPEQIRNLEMRRRRTVATGGREVLDAGTCDATGAGYILARDTYGDKKLSAFFFAPRTMNRVMCSEEITSNHQRLLLLDRLREILAEQKAAKVAPHDLAVGDIVARVWGVTMRSVEFMRVVAVPDPRRVTLAGIPSLQVSGDWMSGMAMPDLDQPERSDHVTYKVSMADGRALVQTGSSIDRTRKWDGKPVHVYSD